MEGGFEDDVELPINIDLQDIQFEDQYQDPDIDGPVENGIPSVEFNWEETDEATDAASLAPEIQIPRRDVELPAQDPDDTSELIEHRQYFDPDMSELKMGLGLFVINSRISRKEYSALHQLLSISIDPAFRNLPASLATFKKHIEKALPLLQIRKKEIPLIPEKLATEAATRKAAGRIDDIPSEDLHFLDPTDLYTKFMSSDISKSMHTGIAEFVDNPTELWHSRCWSSSIRTSSGEYAHFQQGERKPIFPSDFVAYICNDIECIVCTTGTGLSNHKGRVQAVGRDMTAEAAEAGNKGIVVLEIREVLDAIELANMGIVLDPVVKPHELVQLLSDDHHIYVTESQILGAEPVDVELDYVFGETDADKMFFLDTERGSDPTKIFIRRMIELKHGAFVSYSFLLLFLY